MNPVVVEQKLLHVSQKPISCNIILELIGIRKLEGVWSEGFVFLWVSRLTFFPVWLFFKDQGGIQPHLDLSMINFFPGIWYGNLDCGLLSVILLYLIPRSHRAVFILVKRRKEETPSSNFIAETINSKLKLQKHTFWEYVLMKKIGLKRTLNMQENN